MNSQLPKISFILNYAPHYRKAVFKHLDSAFDCTFYFGDALRVYNKKLDYSLLSKPVRELPVRWIYGNWTYYKNYISTIHDDSEVYILTGDMRNVSNWIILLCLKLFYPNKKGLVWTHGWYGKETRFVGFVKKIFFALTDGILCYGDYAKKLMIENGINPQKIHVVHNSLDHVNQISYRDRIKSSTIYEDHFKNKYPTLVFTGRLSAKKRIDMILSAMSILRIRGENYNLIVIGDGDEKENLVSQTNNLGLTNNVWFYGECFDEGVLSNLIYNAALCVSPGNVGLAAIHAMTYGTPTITHSDFSHQMPEFETIKENITGAFFESGDIRSLADTISCWFEVHKNDRELIRENCYKEIDTKWTSNYLVDATKQCLIKLCNK